MEDDFECSEDLFIDPVEDGTLAEVKRINTLEFFEKMRKLGYPDRDKYHVLCKNCLAKKYGVNPHEFDFIQTYGEL